MSDVYEAFDEIAGTGVAIKIERSNDPEFGRRRAKRSPRPFVRAQSRRK